MLSLDPLQVKSFHRYHYFELSFQVWQQQGASCNPPMGAQCQAQAPSLVILLLSSSQVLCYGKMAVAMAVPSIY